MPISQNVSRPISEVLVWSCNLTRLSEISDWAAAVGLLNVALAASVMAAEPSQPTILPQTTSWSGVTAQHTVKRRPWNILPSRPDLRRCHPEPVCIGKSRRPGPRYCRPEYVCQRSACRPVSRLCEPEPVCCDPEPRCCEPSPAIKANGLFKDFSRWRL